MKPGARLMAKWERVEQCPRDGSLLRWQPAKSTFYRALTHKAAGMGGPICNAQFPADPHRLGQLGNAQSAIQEKFNAQKMKA